MTKTIYMMKHIAFPSSRVTHCGYITPSSKQGGVAFDCIKFQDFFKKFDFWGTTWSYDAIKLSADSWDVPFQDSNIILNFRDDLRFLCMGMQTLLMQKMAIVAPWELPYRVKIDLTMKKCRFFKVYYTFTKM